ELFEQAKGIDPGQRGVFLAQACGADTSLLAEVASLVAHGRDAGADFLAPPRSVQVEGPNADPTETPPRVSPVGPGFPAIDGYQILRRLGGGGQGIVYEAIQKTTKRKVAIKVLREEAFASKSAQRRFEREVELVAQLRHPGIIAVFNSGTTTDGR